METQVKRNTKRIGDISEIMVLGALVRAGYYVSVPFGENQRYDLIAEKDCKLFRVQVKTGRLRKGAILFACYSSHAHRGGSMRRYAGEIDFFGVYCPDVDGTYLVPLEDVAAIQVRCASNSPETVKKRKCAGHPVICWRLVGPQPSCGVSAQCSRKCRRSLVVKHSIGNAESVGSIPTDGSIFPA